MDRNQMVEIARDAIRWSAGLIEISRDMSDALKLGAANVAANVVIDALQKAGALALEKPQERQSERASDEIA